MEKFRKRWEKHDDFDLNQVRLAYTHYYIYIYAKINHDFKDHDKHYNNVIRLKIRGRQYLQPCV